MTGVVIGSVALIAFAVGMVYEAVRRGGSMDVRQALIVAQARADHAEDRLYSNVRALSTRRLAKGAGR